MLGNIAADLQWFPIAYIIFTFGALPATLLGLSIISPWLCVFVGLPFIIALLGLIALIGLRDNKPELLPEALKKDPSWLINSLRVEKSQQSEPSDPSPLSPTAASADLGKDNWHQAPAAWGAGWFVVLSLLMVVFNAKWADMKYTSWDKRNHYGMSGWSACSYAFEKSMAWAPAIDEAGCTSTVLNDCGKTLANCSASSDFSDKGGSNSKYEKSWVGCRELCTTSQWKAWCDAQKCGGTNHVQQCLNVSNAVHRPYTVSYMPTGKAWEEGTNCRELDFLCSGVDGSIKGAADLSVVGLVFAGCGLACLVTHAIRESYQGVLFVSLAFWVMAWIMLLTSWAVFAGSLGKDAECKVEAESGKGAVVAIGKFGDIINLSGSYTYGFVIGAWLLSIVPITLILFRIKALREIGKVSCLDGSVVQVVHKA